MLCPAGETYRQIQVAEGANLGKLASEVPVSVTRLLLLTAIVTAIWQNPSEPPAGPAQTKPVPLSPSEAYKSTLAPFVAAKAQPNDLTDADKFALGIGKTQAAHDCLSISSDTSAFATNGKELIALGQLCLFGDRYEPARAALVSYLALPEPPERKLALVLLVRALLGLNEPDGAELQVDSLLHDYPYDAQIHYAIDQVLDATEAADHSKNPFQDLRVLQLCQKQNTATLPLLSSGKGLEGAEISASASTLFIDAVRCAGLARSAGAAQKKNEWSTNPMGMHMADERRALVQADDTLQQLAVIAQQPDWAGKADLLPMQAALDRERMVGAKVPLNALHAHVLGSTTVLSATIPLARGKVVLLPFTLWSPSAADVADAVSSRAPQQTIYAVTSWAANTGSDDAPSKMILAALRLWQETAPPHVKMLIVPDAELRAFHADTFPAGVVIVDGIVRSNVPLSSQGAVRVLAQALNEGNPNSPSPKI